MSLHHHPDISTLISYAAGSLPEALATVVACHLSVCGQCQQQVSEAEQIGSLLLNDIEPVPVSDKAKDALLQKLDQLDNIQTLTIKKTSQPIGESPALLQKLLKSKQLDQLNWKSMAPGMKQYIISHSDDRLRLLKIAPGTCMPVHGHTGSELTMVLRGSYTDETGHYSSGDIADLGSDIQHQPVVDSHQECICLIATDAPLRFVNWVPRLLQPFFGI
ncbi:ChrR family anti-sigma-E factor [Endozoicomonas sp. Mp262]|uniref:ChrR family anti-sigma-E factor n=1 Tax=Endozoicomonas sp. Mp262 TaxID=2919499 RepID=UPI0021DAF8DB